MREYLAHLPQYIYRVFHRLDFICGGVIAIIYFFLSDLLGIAHERTLITFGIVSAALLEASYGVYREEHEMRREAEAQIRITTRLHAWAINHPDPGPDKVSLSLQVAWEIWVEKDAFTEAVALNLIYLYDRKWWQIWKQTRFPQTGIPPRRSDSTEYRVQVPANAPQPFKDADWFDYVGERELEGDPHWLAELVIKFGMPERAYRMPVSIHAKQEELKVRGTNPPL